MGHGGERLRIATDETEVDDLRGALVGHDDVGRLEIAMNDTLRMDGREALRNLSREPNLCGPVDTFLHHLEQHLSLEPLHDEVRAAVFGDTEIDQSHHVGIDDGGERLRFAHETLVGGARLADVRGEEFEGAVFEQQRVSHPIDARGDALTEQLVDTIVADDAAQSPFGS